MKVLEIFENKMKLKNINLPTKIEDSWFYKDEKYREQLEPYLGWQYISYSTAGDLTEYFEDLIKEKITKVKGYTETVYSRFGNFIGYLIESGTPPEDNPEGFLIDSSFDVSKFRPEGAEYEKLVTLELSKEEKVLFIGFIDVYYERNGLSYLRDSKTGSESKVGNYKKDKYTQLVLYAYALEQSGYKIGGIGVDFFYRNGSHLNPPLKLSGKHTDIPLEYSKERIKFALDTLLKNTQYISDLYTTYQKFLKPQ